MRILQCCVHSTLLYGSETWTLNKVLEKKIEAFEMWTFRRIGKISWKEKKTNKEVCEILDQTPSLLKTIKTRKLKFCGHTSRHNSITKHILYGGTEGERPRGRPPRVWLDDVKSWTGLSVEECSAKSHEREEWRVIASRPLPKR